MRSAAESQRRAWRLEGLWRGIALAGLVTALVAALWLLRRAREVPVRAVHVEVSAALPAVQRDSLAALARAGREVSWSGPLASVMAVAEALREPVTRWRVSAVGDAALALRDSLGPVDSLASGEVLTTEPTRGPVQAWDGTTVAIAAAPTPHRPRGALVFGRVGWEPRFVITALEESGWRVDARLDLGRDRAVRQGNAVPDIARHAVVVVVDSASARREAAALSRFLRAGGGVVLAGEAAAALPAALRGIAGARVVGTEPPETRDFAGHEPTHALPLFALGALRADAVLVEDREGTPAIVARRVGGGRLLQMGYAETWRWRMQGEAGSLEAHRAFWSRLAGAVAASAPAAADPAAERDTRNTLPGAARRAFGDAAPRAALVHALGAERPEPRRVAATAPRLPWWLGIIILSALLAEWGSRRRRGVA